MPMKQILLVITIVVTIPFTVRTQNKLESYDFDNFKKLESKGKIPDDFLLLSSKKYENERQKNNASSRKNRKIKDDFYKKSSFHVDELLQSGIVCFGDPVTEYVNKVADYILQDDKELKDKLRFYTIKSNVTNAFSTDPGMIFITSGLISQLENEAQLAFVLAHEIAHYTEKHVIENYVENKRIDEEYKDDEEERIKQYSKYSQSHELDADLIGAKRYIEHLEYSPSELVTSFLVLQFSNLPFDDIPFDKSYFNVDNFYIPPSLIKDTVKSISTEIDPDDYENSTHPNINDRRKQIQSQYSSLEDNGEYFKVYSQEEFEVIRDICRFQNINNDLQNRNYELALYQTFMLHQKYPDNKFLDKSLCKSLLGYNIYISQNERYKIQVDLDDIEGESFTLYSFLRDLSKTQLAILTARICFDKANQYPHEQAFKNFAEIAFIELAKQDDFDFSDFKPVSYQKALAESQKGDTTVLVQTDTAETETTNEVDKEETKELSKYDKILAKEKENQSNEVTVKQVQPEDFHLFAFGTHIESAFFRSLVETAEKAIDEEDGETLSYSERSQTQKHINKKGQSLDIDHIIVVNPILKRWNETKGDEMLYSEAQQMELTNMILESSLALDLKTDILNVKSLSQDEVSKFNAIATLKAYLSEQIEHIDDIETTFNSQSTILSDLQSEFGTSKVLFPIVLSIKEKENFAKLLWILTGFGAPFVIADLVTADNTTAILHILIDTESKDILLQDVKVFDRKPTKGLLRLHTYDILNQIKRSSK